MPRLTRLAALVAALAAASALAAGPAAAASPDIVVSQVYGGGGNAGAALTNDFVELFNRGTTAVNVTGWSVQYASAGGSSWQVTALSGTLQPGQYYLVQEAQGAGGTTPLPTPDATGSIPMSATSGKVALVTSTTALSCGAVAGDCFPNAAIRDFAGYGTATNFEGGAAAPTLSNTTAALRGAGGCTDADQNGSDFASAAPAPRNTASPLSPCEGDPVLLTCPAEIQTEVGTPASAPVQATDADGRVISIIVNSIVPSPTAGSIALSGFTPAAATGGTATASLDVDGDVPAGSYTVQLVATNDDATPQTGVCDVTVDVLPPAVSIPEIQGSGLESPLAGTTQRTSGVVTVVLGNGFFLQDPVGDGDPATSDGIFVFTGSALARTVAPGDVLGISGTVTEFRPATRPRDLALTELNSVSFTKTGTAALPGPAVISDLPNTLIDPDGIDAFERLEGMLVSVARPTVTGPTNDFGELVVAASGDLGSTTPLGNLIVTPLGGGLVDYNPERIMLDDEARAPGGTGSGTRINSPQVQARVGDDATGDVVGALDYQFSNFRVQVSHPLADVLSGTSPASPVGGLPAPEPWEGRIATFNVENLFDCVDAPGKDDDASCSAADLTAIETKLTKLAAAFQGELLSPELAIVEETENTEVLTGDGSGNVPGTTIPALLPRLGGNYDAVSFDASDVRGIEVAFVFDTDRVTLHEAFLATSILPDTGGLFDGSVWRAGREPLVGRFTLDGIDLIVVGNHLKSKGGPQFGVDIEPGDDPLYGAFQPPTRFTEELRHPQADYVRELVDLLLSLHPGAGILVGGDLNDFAFAEPGEGLDTVARITSSPTDPLTNVVELVPEDERYTFVFEGNSQVLDHLLVNAPLADRSTGQAIAHFNAGFPNAFAADPSVTFRASDHDPLVGYFCTDGTAPELSVSLSPNVLWPPKHRQRVVRATVTATDDLDPDVSIELVSAVSDEPDDAPGGGDGHTRNDVIVLSDFLFKLRAERAGNGDGRVYTITYRATDECGNETEAGATVSVPISRP
jgi:predicted extracellular nuclease